MVNSIKRLLEINTWQCSCHLQHICMVLWWRSGQVLQCFPKGFACLYYSACLCLNWCSPVIVGKTWASCEDNAYGWCSCELCQKIHFNRPLDAWISCVTGNNIVSPKTMPSSWNPAYSTWRYVCWIEWYQRFTQYRNGMRRIFHPRW